MIIVVDGRGPREHNRSVEYMTIANANQCTRSLNVVMQKIEKR